MTTKIRELMLRAAIVMETRGMAKGEFEDDTGRVCLRGALAVADRGHAMLFVAGAPLAREADKIVERYLHDEGLAPQSWCAATWNNAPETTEEKVVEVLRHLGGLEQDDEQAPNERELVPA